ncbi:hypothetical protein GE09DRAFT_754851 [Coniochaeta sp. 2T2.1]|nr:hypothetical protein GE09DRAFT_754851 [Coniochaeta sp. 2T2.1]
MKLSLASLPGLAALVSSHGLVQKPAARQPGDATGAACGKTMQNFYQIDNTSYPEALLRANPGGLKDGYDAKKCNLFLCKGYQFADNAARVQAYKPGDVVDMEVWIRIPHKGYANVSVVDTASNTVVGSPLLVWKDNYAATANPPKDQTKFSVTVPELGGKCTTAGACVIQWYWLGQGQTYESCIDFTVPAAAPSTPAIRGRTPK